MEYSPSSLSCLLKIGIRFFITNIVSPTKEYATAAAVSPTTMPALCIIMHTTHIVSTKAGRRLKIDLYKNWLLARRPRSKARLANPDRPSSWEAAAAGLSGAAALSPLFTIMTYNPYTVIKSVKKRISRFWRLICISVDTIFSM
jgi:hypothetical protein